MLKIRPSKNKTLKQRPLSAMDTVEGLQVLLRSHRLLLRRLRLRQSLDVVS